MQPSRSDIQTPIEAFWRRTIARERLYRRAVATLAIDLVMRQLQEVAKPPRRRRPLLAPLRALVRRIRRLL